MDPPQFEDPHIQAAWLSLASKLEAKAPTLSLERIREAVEFGVKAHEGQTRASGEPYIVHPIEVAAFVVDLEMDVDSVVAAVLHDVLEDTNVTTEQITAKFGKDVTRLVQGVTKLQTSVKSDDTPSQKAAAESARAAESLRKMLLAVAQDVRVMVIKLADRLHNMRTIGNLPPEKQTRIANETLEIYAPLAARLGIWQIKWQLEDLAFKVLHPTEFSRISSQVAATRVEREGQIKAAVEELTKRLEKDGLTGFTISGRPKHLYSIFNKIVKQKISFEEVYDLIAIRVITSNQTDCYTVLGVVHDLWIPIFGQFSDYIGTPKPNGYQSIHTKVMGPKNEPLEVQIRSQQMHDVAEHGVAAHWSYKEGKPGKNLAEAHFETLRKQLFDWTSEDRGSSDFLRSVTTDLFAEQVFAFTPKGDVIDLPAGSTPIDFAFRIHSDIGQKMVGAKINGVIVPLSTEIKNGDVVSLDTRNNAQPTIGWLKFAKSAHTKNKIRAFFRKRNRDERIAQGRDALDKEVKGMGLDPRIYLGDEMMKEVIKKLKDCDEPADVFARVGEGLLSVKSVTDRIKQLLPEQPVEAIKAKPKVKAPTLITTGVDNVMVKRARCCQPVPGEEVVGYVTRGRGVVLHQKVCQNVLQLLEKEPERIQPVRWDLDGKMYDVTLKILSTNRQGLLADMSNCFSESKANVVHGTINTTKHNTADNDFTIEVRDIHHLRDVMSRLGQFADIMHVLRVQPRGGR